MTTKLGSPRRSFTEQARREQIVNAAIEVLDESGFAAASISAIAERVGVSKGVVSYYFAGKNELLQEIVTRVLVEAAEYMSPRVAAAKSSLEALRVYVTSNLEYIDAQRHKIIAFIEIVNGVPPGGAEPPPYGEGHRRAVEDLQHLLEAGQRRGEFGAFSAHVAAVSLRASIDAVSTPLRADPSMDVAAYGAQLLNLFERAVRA